jgi:hypothetical protein
MAVYWAASLMAVPMVQNGGNPLAKLESCLSGLTEQE